MYILAFEYNRMVPGAIYPDGKIGRILEGVGWHFSPTPPEESEESKAPKKLITDEEFTVRFLIVGLILVILTPAVFSDTEAYAGVKDGEMSVGIRGKLMIASRHDPRYWGLYVWGKPLGEYLEEKAIQVVGNERINGLLCYVVRANRRGGGNQYKQTVNPYLEPS